MGSKGRKRRISRRRSGKQANPSNRLRLHLERLEERWLLNSQGVIESSLFTDDLLTGSSLFNQSATPDVADGSSAGLSSGSGGEVTVTSSAPWEFKGPAPVINVFGGGHFNLDPNFGTGAIEAIAAHPSDPSIVYIGSASGGIWKTDEAHLPSPNWTPLTDVSSSLSIGAIAISPIDINANGTSAGTITGKTIYAGTGSFSSGGLASGDAVGVLRSIDGENFELMPGSDIFAREGLKIRSIVPLNVFDGTTMKQVVLVAAVDSTETKGGIYRSAQAGANFVKVSEFMGVTGCARNPSGC